MHRRSNIDTRKKSDINGGVRANGRVKRVVHFNRIVEKLQNSSQFRNVFMISTALELIVRKHVLGQGDAAIGRWCSVRLPMIGPTYIKIGQYVASRSDIFGKEFSSQLKNLNDSVPGKKCRREIRKQCAHTETRSSTIYIEPEPIATASIGQVHKGKLKLSSGKVYDVVTKICRPNIGSMIESDVRFIGRCVDVAEGIACNLGQSGAQSGRRGGPRMESLRASFEEIRRKIQSMDSYLRDEINFAREVRNMQVFRSKYRHQMDEIRLPCVFAEHCTDTTIVMEYVPTTNILAYSRTLPPVSRKQLATDLMAVFTNHMLYGGLMHGDPHQGNMGIDDAGKLVLFDFGNIVRISTKTRHMLKNSMLMICMNHDDIAIENLAQVGVHVRDRQFIQLFRNYMRTMDIREIMDVCKNQENKADIPIKLDDNMMQILRSYSILEGTCKSIYPKFNYDQFVQENVHTFVADSDFFAYKARYDTRSLMLRSMDVIRVD
jgi:predicted unusual protein kinase regulating ubiquinone biosynthesis (AarF/ABC1/UbiB family)